MNNYVIGGIAAIVLIGGAFFLFSGNSGSDAGDNGDAASSVASNDTSDGDASDGTQTMASADNDGDSNNSADGTPRLHPVESACVEYEMVGQMMNGTTTRCHRNYAYEQYEIQNTTVGMAGITQTQNQHNITIGDQIYAINLDTNTGTQTTNPMYAGIAAAMQDSSPEEMSATFIASMGFSPTGETKNIAGENCNMYSAAQLGDVCLMDNGLMLEQSFMGNTQTATSVSIGDGGDDANYTLYQNVPITQGPDLSNGLDGLMDQFGNQ